MADPLPPGAGAAKGADPWLTIIGIGEDGHLPPPARVALSAAKAVFGAPRHLALAGIKGDSRAQAWPLPFSTAPVLALRGQAVAVLASGDPFWHGAGGVLTAELTPGEWCAFPAPSTFALAAAHMGWRLEETLCLGLHAAPFARLRPLLAPGMQVLCLMRDGAAPAELAGWLTTHGWGATQVTALERLGGPQERVRQAPADAFAMDCAAPVTVALEVEGAAGLPRASGLPDDAFAHDGQITKRPVRALTLSALAPQPGAHLWDVGAGSGSVTVEFLLAAPGSRATLIEPRADRLTILRQNLDSFGLGHRTTVIAGSAPEALGAALPPDVVFLGGGASAQVLQAIWSALRPGARLVANAVTLETESLLTEAHARHGGALLRLTVEEAAPLGRMRGWQAARPITQWSVTR